MSASSGGASGHPASVFALSVDTSSSGSVATQLTPPRRLAMRSALAPASAIRTFPDPAANPKTGVVNWYGALVAVADGANPVTAAATVNRTAMMRTGDRYVMRTPLGRCSFVSDGVYQHNP